MLKALLKTKAITQEVDRYHHYDHQYNYNINNGHYGTTNSEFGDSFTPPNTIAPNINDTTIPDFHVSISKAFCIPSATEFA
jgi:hypothetical protein